MTLYETAVQQIANLGILSIFVPFILIYSLIFLLLEASKLLYKSDNDSGNDKTARKLHSLFSFGFALMAMAHQDLIKWMIFFVPNAVVFVLALFLFLMSIALLVNPKKLGGATRGFIYLIAILVIVFLAAEGVGIGGEPVSGIISSLHGVLTDLIGIIIVIVGFIALVWWLGSGDSNNKRKSS